MFHRIICYFIGHDWYPLFRDKRIAMYPKCARCDHTLDPYILKGVRYHE